MAYLRDDEVRRLLGYLRQQRQDTERLAYLEDELRSEYGAEFLREPELMAFFPSETVSLEFSDTIWSLRVIGYTRLRMTPRGIHLETVTALFARFVEHCRASSQLIAVGPYTIYSRLAPRATPLTLRVDVDDISDEQGQAHTVTVFVGHGDSYSTEEVNLLS